MSLKNETKVATVTDVYTRPFIPVLRKINLNLMDTNIGEGNNDIVFNNLLQHYNISLADFEST